MEPYIEFIGTLQNSGFWLVKAYIHSHLSKKRKRAKVLELKREPSCDFLRGRHEIEKPTTAHLEAA